MFDIALQLIIKTANHATVMSKEHARSTMGMVTHAHPVLDVATGSSLNYTSRKVISSPRGGMLYVSNIPDEFAPIIHELADPADGNSYKNNFLINLDMLPNPMKQNLLDDKELNVTWGNVIAAMKERSSASLLKDLSKWQ